MRTKLFLVVAVIVFLLAGHTRAWRELRNPDAEPGSFARTVLAIKRAQA